ncbi:MAG TPA: hypothetical protein VI199_04350 [Novosphingobium sp.]
MELKHLAVDTLAASNLLTRLGLEQSPQLLAAVAGLMATHRVSAIEWAAERAHETIVQQLEARSLDLLGDHNEDWASGFRYAEQVVWGLTATELLGELPARTMSKGQVLRSMLRQARRKVEQASRRPADPQ